MLVSSIVLVAIDFVYLNVIKDYFGSQIQRVQNSPMKINYIKYLA